MNVDPQELLALSRRVRSRLNEATIAFRRGELARARSLLDAAEATFADSQMAVVAIDDRFELDWLREQLACAAS